MRPCDQIECHDFSCSDVNLDAYLVPDVDVNPADVRVFMVSEVPPADVADYFYAPGEPFYGRTTEQAFNEAGIAVSGMQDILDLGVYATTAVKCGQTQYAISAQTARNCSRLLEREAALFAELRVFLLMGDVAIKVA